MWSLRLFSILLLLACFSQSLCDKSETVHELNHLLQNGHPNVAASCKKHIEMLSKALWSSGPKMWAEQSKDYRCFAKLKVPKII